jgi:hypothetical protein
MILIKWISIFILAMILASSCGKAPAPAPTVPSTTLPALGVDGTLLIWRNDGEPCETALFTLEELSFGPCSGTLAQALTGPTTRTQRLSQLVNTYASFTEQTEAGKVSFSGKGSNIATAAEQRAIAEWAKLEYQVVQAGRAGAAWGLAFAWQREGGIAGFCDDVGVYLTGMVIVSNCKGLNEQFYLTASQLEQLFEWLDRLNNIDYYYKDPAVADAMITSLVFCGAGHKNASADDIRDINTFAASLQAQGVFGSQAVA